MSVGQRHRSRLTSPVLARVPGSVRRAVGVGWRSCYTQCRKSLRRIGGPGLQFPVRWRWPEGPRYLSPAHRAGYKGDERICGLKGRDTTGERDPDRGVRRPVKEICVPPVGNSFSERLPTSARQLDFAMDRPIALRKWP